MGLLSKVLLAPITLPPRSTIWLAQKLTEAAEAQRNDPAVLRRALAAAEEQLLNGEISEDVYDEIETEILTRLRMMP